MRVFRWITAALIAVYLVLTPPLIGSGLERDAYFDWLEPEQPAWRGRVVIWHIADFRVYQGSVTHYLAARAKVYEKSHPGVVIEVVGLTSEQFAERAARGAFPDAYSFPCGLLYAEQLRSAEYALPALSGTLTPAVSDGKTYAVPYLMSGYFLCANAQLLSKYRFELPGEPADKAFFQSVLDLKTDPAQLAMPPLFAARLGLSGTPAETSAFTAGKSMIGLIDARALGELTRGASAALSIEAQPYAGVNDQVLYIGAARGASDARTRVVADFAAFLLSAEEQARLSTLGALPVTAEAAPVYADASLSALFMCRESFVCLDPFSYQRHKDALDAEARAALAGDEAAKKSFFERIKVVERGEF